jgi:hypothetical protein
VSKPVIKNFKGIPVYLSYFVIYPTRNPIIRTYTVSLEISINGTGKSQTNKATQVLGFHAFADACFLFMDLAYKKKDQLKKMEENHEDNS